MDLSLYGLTGIEIALDFSYLAHFFAVLVVFSSVIVLFIAKNYKLSKSFYALFALLNLSLFLIVYAADYLLFFIGWEVMSITTYFLLAPTLSKEALHKYIIFALASALALFMAIVILYSGAGSFLYIDAKEGFLSLGMLEKILFLVLFLFGIFVKIGTIGVHYWVIDAYEESHNFFTPYLSAVLSKMGIYALIILSSHVIALSFPLAIIGVITSIIATFKAIQEDSIKRLLAYSSIAQLGYIVTVVALADGMGGALYHSLIHTLIKLLLFINIAGIIFVTARDRFSTLGGLIYKTPQSFVLLLIGIITLAGMPPLSGFASKFMIYSSLMSKEFLIILSAVMFSSASAFIYVYKLVYGVYLGHPTNKKLEIIKEVPYSFLIPQYIIVLVIFALSFFPALVVEYFNLILFELGLKSIEFSDITTLHSEFADYNGFMLLCGFIAIFALVLLLFVNLRSKAKNTKDRFDIAYCGEVPDESTHLHYGYSMGKELRRVDMLKPIYNNSVKPFYDYLITQTQNLSQLMRKIYTGDTIAGFYVAIIFLVILLFWGVK